MKKQIALLSVASAFLFSCSKPNTQNQLPSFEKFSSNLQLSETENCHKGCLNIKKEFMYVVYVGKQIYCYWDEKQAEQNLDFNEKAREFEAQITDNTSATEYYTILQKWAALFHDGHVNAMLGSDMSDLEFYTTGLRLEVLAPGTDHEQLIVAAATPGLSLKPGTVIEKIQGKPWQDYRAAALKFVSGSTEAMRARFAGNSFFRVLLEQEGPRAVRIEGTFKGEPVSVVAPRTLALYDSASAPEPPPATGIDAIKSSILENNIGYLRIDGFGGTKMRALMEQAMVRLAGTSGLIIDVRRNGGGDMSGDMILSYLIDKEIVRFSQRVVDSDYLLAARPDNLFDYDLSGTDRFSPMVDRKVKPQDTPYKKPVIVMTSPNCFSACDTFVSAIKENKLGEIVGERTGGGTGNPLVFELPYSGHSFRYSVARGYTAVGQELLEGKGTLPDVVMEPTLEERVKQEDLQLNRAAQYLLTKIQPQIDPPAIMLPNALLSQVPLVPSNIPLEVELDREIRKSSD